MKACECDLVKPSFWQLVFLQSKVNGAAYRGEQLPRRNWNWPQDTYLQQRLRLAKWYHAPDTQALGSLPDLTLTHRSHALRTGDRTLGRQLNRRNARR